MKKPISLICFFVTIAFFSTYGQEKEIGIIQNEIAGYSKTKFENPELVKNKLFQILLQYKHLPENISSSIYKEIAGCFGLMHQLDSGIIYIKKGLLLVSNKGESILLLNTLGNLCTMSSKFETADSSFKAALQLCDKLKADDMVKAQVLADYSTFYCFQYNYTSSLKLLNQAISIIQTAKRIDSSKLILFREKMARIYLDTKNYDFSEKSYLENIKSLQSGNQNGQLANNYIGIAEVYQSKKQIEQSDIYFSKALAIYTRINNVNNQHYCLMNMAENKLLSNHAATAENIIKTAFEGMRAANSIYLLEAATIYLKVLDATKNNTTAQAIIEDEYIQKMLSDDFSEDALAYYKATMPFFIRSNNIIAENNTLNKIITVTDSVNNETKRKEILEIEAKFQVKINGENEAILVAKNRILEQDNKLKNISLAYYVVFIIITLIILSKFLHNFKKRLKRKKEDLKKTTEENVRLSLYAESEVAEKNKKQDIIEEQKIEMLNNVEKMHSLETEIKFRNEKNLSEEKNGLVLSLNQLKEGNEHLELFMAKFTGIYPTFAANLVKCYPKISNSDVLFCSLTKMNLLPKDIASIMNIEQLSVYKRKYRISEKMGLHNIEEFNESIFAIM